MLQTLFQNPLKQSLSDYNEIVKAINAFEPKLEKLTQQEIQERTQKLKIYASNEDLKKEVVIEAFALVREATKRVLKIRHFDVQLIGGLILNDGKIKPLQLLCNYMKNYSRLSTSTKKINFHYGLLSCQLTSTANSAQQSWISCANSKGHRGNVKFHTFPSTFGYQENGIM